MTALAAQEPAKRSPARLPRWRTIAALGLAYAAWAALHSWSERHAFLINVSQSLPNWAFFVEKGAVPRRGQYVFFRVPESPLIQRHFGKHPQPFGKLVMGVAGDMVTRQGSAVLVNGAVVATLKPFSKRGEVLTPGPLGRVPDGCYFAATPHKDGFDSRYADIGWVCGKQIVGTGVPVL